MTQPVETFTAYMAGLPTASTPLGSSDTVLVLQSGLAKRSPATSSLGLVANTTLTSGFTAGQFLYSDGTKLQAGNFSTGLNLAGGNLTSILVGNSVTTSGFSANQLLYSDGTLLQAGTVGTGLSFSGGTLSFSGMTVNSTTVTGGSANNLLYTDGSKLQASGGITFTATGQLTMAAGSITTSVPALSITQTWNLVGTTFTGLFFNVTNTASATASRIFDFQVNGTSQFSMNQAGYISLGGNISLRGDSGPQLSVLNFSTSTFANMKAAAGEFTGTLTVDGSNGSTYILAQAGQLSFGSFDPSIIREAANTLGVQNGANATSWRVYKTNDSAFAPANYERGIFDWLVNSNVLTVGAQALGTGTLRPMEFVGANFLLNASDTGIFRNGAGIVEINSGTVGTLRDLTVRDAYTNDATFFIRTKTTLTSSPGVGAGTLTNAPSAGNPTKWIGIDDNGTTRQVPAW